MEGVRATHSTITSYHAAGASVSSYTVLGVVAKYGLLVQRQDWKLAHTELSGPRSGKISSELDTGSMSLERCQSGGWSSRRQEGTWGQSVAEQRLKLDQGLNVCRSFDFGCSWSPRRKLISVNLGLSSMDFLIQPHVLGLEVNCVAGNELELLVFLSLLSEFWDDWHKPSCHVHWFWGSKWGL